MKINTLPDREYSLSLTCGFVGFEVDENTDLSDFTPADLIEISIKTDKFLKSLLKELNRRKTTQL